MSNINFCSAFYLENDELSAMREGTFEIHCLSMRLEKPEPKAKKYLGAGFIRQTSNNKFEFVMYSRKVMPPDDVMDEIFGREDIRPGLLYPASHYYKLTCTDGKGRKWICDRILNPGLGNSENGTLVTGSFDSMTCHVHLPRKVEKSYLSLEFMGKYKIPANTPTRTNKTVGGEQVASSSSLNVLQFTFDGINFSIRSEDKYLQVEAKCEKKLPDNIETRISEALQFVLGRALSWTIMTKQENKSGQIVLKASSQNTSREIRPPTNILHDNGASFCNLFSRYLAFITSSESTKIHPISSQIRSVILANSVNIETLALVLSVAVESILQFINTKSILSDEELQSIVNAKEYFTNWNGSERLTARINGLLRSIVENPGAKDILNELVKARVTTSKHKKAWEILRNKLAHGGRMGSTPLQEFLDLTHIVLVLFYHLVFHVIGYKGKYTDYSTVEWPEAAYPLNSTQAEE